MESFSSQLLRARKAKGMTQEQLAELLQTSRSNISHWENGRTLPDIETVKRLSRILGCNFLDGREPMEGKDEPPVQEVAVPGTSQEAYVREEAVPKTDVSAEAPSPTPQKKSPWRWLGPALAAVAVAIVVCVVLLQKPQSSGEAKIAFYTRESPIYMGHYDDMGGNGWRVDVVMVNESDVPFTPERVVAEFMEGEKRDGFLRVGYGEIRTCMLNDKLLKDEQALLPFGTNHTNCDRVKLTLTGTDDNGHAQEYVCETKLLQEKKEE